MVLTVAQNQWYRATLPQVMLHLPENELWEFLKQDFSWLFAFTGLPVTQLTASKQ